MFIEQTNLDQLWKNLLEFQLTPIELGILLNTGLGYNAGDKESANRFVYNARGGSNSPITTKQVFDHFVANTCGYSMNYCSTLVTFVMYAKTTSDSEREWCKFFIEKNLKGDQHCAPSEERCLRIVEDMKRIGINLWPGTPQKIPPNPELDNGR